MKIFNRLYDQDGLRTAHNHDFMSDPTFKRAYARGVKAAGRDYKWHWRVHVGLWAAKTAEKVEGDFVECGVNMGFLSSAIMELLDWNRTNRMFYLMDTFSGIDERYISDEDRKINVMDRNKKEIASGFYATSAEKVVANFSEWDNKKFIIGAIPETLPQLAAEKIAFAHIDMNCSPPEVAALEYMWPRLTKGAVVLLDDYAYDGYVSQKIGMDRLAAQLGVAILALPTGQGLILKN